MTKEITFARLKRLTDKEISEPIIRYTDAVKYMETFSNARQKVLYWSRTKCFFIRFTIYLRFRDF